MRGPADRRPAALAKFAELAKDDPSPVVRLYLASALQRMPAENGWAIAEGLITHEKDAGDANLPLMDWYGIEPLVPADPNRALRTAWRRRRFLSCDSSSAAGSLTMPGAKERKDDLGPADYRGGRSQRNPGSSTCSRGRARGCAAARA